MKKLKCKKGITLVTLVITVIILIILAMLTVSMVTGDGIFKYAKLEEGKISDLQTGYNELLNKEGNYLNGINNPGQDDDTPTTGGDGNNVDDDTPTTGGDGNNVDDDIPTTGGGGNNVDADTPTTGDEEDPVHPPHILNNWVVTKAATCIATGVKTRSCTVEGCDYTETEQIQKDSNNHEKAKEVVISPATCVSDAIKYMYCSACSTQWNRVVTQKAYGHSWNTISTQRICDHKHVIEYECGRCGKVETSTQGHYPRGYEYQYTYGTYGSFKCICDSGSLVYYPSATRKRYAVYNCTSKCFSYKWGECMEKLLEILLYL